MLQGVQQPFAYQADLLEKFQFILEEANEAEISRFIEELQENQLDMLKTVAALYFPGRDVFAGWKKPASTSTTTSIVSGAPANTTPLFGRPAPTAVIPLQGVR